MYSIASDWKLVINQSRTAVVDNNRSLPIAAIEPDIVLTHNTIAVYVTSQSAKPTWYKSGYLYQAFLIPFGTAGAAQGEQIAPVLNRYHIHRFTTFPDVDENKYVLSFSPVSYLRDVNIKVWEYVGTNQGATLDSLQRLSQQNLQRTAGLQTSINKLLKKK